jgi:hypothetical protein
VVLKLSSVVRNLRRKIHATKCYVEQNEIRGPRRKLGDNVKVDIREAGCVDVDWIQLAQDKFRWRALVNTVMKLRVS